MSKIIHYFWDGGRKPRIVRKCIASWSRVMPDWEVREWNFSNWDVSRYQFSKETAKLGLWAFISDVARWDILYREGGVFLDTDVELVRPLDDLCGENWMAAECDEPLRANPGLGMYFKRGSSFAAAQLEVYAKLRYDPMRKFDFSSPWVVSQSLNRPDAPKVFPCVYFNPRGWSGGRVPHPLDPRTYAIHHFAGSWFNLKQKMVYTILPRMGMDVGKIVRKFSGKKS